MADALHARYDSVADEAVPKRLEIERLARQPRKWMAGANWRRARLARRARYAR